MSGGGHHIAHSMDAMLIELARHAGDGGSITLTSVQNGARWLISMYRYELSTGRYAHTHHEAVDPLVVVKEAHDAMVAASGLKP